MNKVIEHTLDVPPDDAQPEGDAVSNKPVKKGFWSLPYGSVF